MSLGGLFSEEKLGGGTVGKDNIDSGGEERQWRRAGRSRRKGQCGQDVLFKRRICFK